MPGFNYAEGGFYFVTVVTVRRACVLSNIVDFQIHLSTLGQMVEEQLANVSARFPNILVDSYVIMPNHLHILLRIEDAFGSAKLSRVVNEFKGRVTVRFNQITNRRGTVWQYGYYDVIVRSERQLLAIRKYIENNPVKWEIDQLNPKCRNDGASACATFSSDLG
jgi:REP element-mobilizing transposase RayT